MLSISRTKYFMKIVEVFFNPVESNLLPRSDVIIYFQMSKQMEGSRKFKTLHIDLSKDESVLHSELDKNTRYEVKRASTKDDLKCTIYTPNEEDIYSFCRFYNFFARSKSLPLSNLEKLKSLHKVGGLIFSVVKDENDSELCYHAYIADGKRARLLYSASHYRDIGDSASRSLIGRANRYLHWMDIQYFKQSRFSIYDFGGISESGELKNIDNFKRGFGGKEVVEYTFYDAQSFLGKLALSYFLGKLGK